MGGTGLLTLEQEIPFFLNKNVQLKVKTCMSSYVFRTETENLVLFKTGSLNFSLINVR